MALTKNIETATGINVPNAYFRVEDIFLSKSVISFTLRNYVVSTKPPLSKEDMTCAYDILGENPFKQAYDYIKTLPEFADATDV
jgi:hypothetical protein